MSDLEILGAHECRACRGVDSHVAYNLIWIRSGGSAGIACGSKTGSSSWDHRDRQAPSLFEVVPVLAQNP